MISALLLPKIISGTGKSSTFSNSSISEADRIGFLCVVTCQASLMRMAGESVIGIDAAGEGMITWPQCGHSGLAQFPERI